MKNEPDRLFFICPFVPGTSQAGPYPAREEAARAVFSRGSSGEHVLRMEIFMSQAKVDRYKEEKANRKKIMKMEKRKHVAGIICGWAVFAAIAGWAGYSAYSYYEDNKPMETIYADLDAINDYINGLDSD